MSKDNTGNSKIISPVVILLLFLIPIPLLANPATEKQQTEFDIDIARFLILTTLDGVDKLGAESKNWNQIENYRGYKELERALFMLRSCRQNYNSSDLQGAAAEHYLLTRYMASKTGNAYVRDWPHHYHAYKETLTKKGLAGTLAVTDKPPSALSIDVTTFGVKGANTGLREYEKRTGLRVRKNSAALVENALKETKMLLLVTVANNVFKRRKPAKNVCNLRYFQALDINERSSRKRKLIIYDE